MSRGRAYTRHQRQRAWKKAWHIVKHIYRIYDQRWGWTDKNLDVELTRHIYKNRHPCSCPMCSADRDLFGPPYQELKQPDIKDFDEDLIEP
jgi:hypothetical protein